VNPEELLDYLDRKAEQCQPVVCPWCAQHVYMEDAVYYKGKVWHKCCKREGKATGE